MNIITQDTKNQIINLIKDSVKMFRNFHKKERTRGTIPI